ncbi:MAG: hypothetical protein FWD88_05655, partial [Treponema sp.]|nr:hypothetical protein [Treponema sp.]
SIGVIILGGAFPGRGEEYSLGISATARFFPGGSIFYMELGLGFGWLYSWNWSRSHSVIGLMVTPAIGLRLDFGRDRGFFMSPFLSLPLVIGNVRWSERGSGGSNSGSYFGAHINTSRIFGVGLGRRF